MGSQLFRKKLIENYWKINVGVTEGFELDGNIRNKNVGLCGVVHIPYGLISVSRRHHWMGSTSHSPGFFLACILKTESCTASFLTAT